MAISTPSQRPRSDPPIQRAEAEARRLGLALFPVRLFLGVTFVYGGIQKLSDPGYLHPGAPTYIGTQLHGFASGTPGGFLLRALAIPHPRLAGIGVAVVEIIIGLLVTSGVFTRPAAAIGLALNLLLFLTNSWHIYPYFLGSDIVFVFAWLPFVFVGASRQPSLETALQRLAAAMTDGRPARPDGVQAPGTDPELTRRAALRAAVGVTGVAAAAIAGVSVLARGAYHAPRGFAAATKRRAVPTPKVTNQPPAGVAAPAPTAAPTAALPAGAVKLGASSQLPAGQGATYPDPSTGAPDIVVRETSGRLVAHSAVCTHAGCTVAYQGGQLLCPCHGAVYDAQTGAVLGGPAPAPLAPRKVIERAGEIYALPG
jgi:thiosulfate dehydrogenase [quinone] large subunit